MPFRSDQDRCATGTRETESRGRRAKTSKQQLLDRIGLRFHNGRGILAPKCSIRFNMKSTLRRLPSVLRHGHFTSDSPLVPSLAFTSIPAILNESRTAEFNVRTGCLRALSYVFEYTRPQSAYYADSVATVLEDVLTDGGLVRRQTASTIVKHIALGVAGLGCEDSMLHLMDLVWPNCFETPHVIGAVMDAIGAMRVTLKPGVLLSCVLQGLFHPARKVREVRVVPVPLKIFLNNTALSQVYWRAYNSLYIGAVDALVPLYPDLGELSEGQNVYSRHPLQMFV